MPKEIEGTPYFLIPEAAQELGIRTGTLRAYIKQGRLSRERIDGVYRIAEPELRQYQARLAGLTGVSEPAK